MAGYSSTPLVKKLGIKENFRLYLKNPPDNYFSLVNPLPDKVQILRRLSPNLDMVHFFTRLQQELKKEVPKHLERINRNGAIWVSWPKKSANVQTDITEDVIRKIVLPLGLVDIKVCAVDDMWSGLKCVIRQSLR